VAVGVIVGVGVRKGVTVTVAVVVAEAGKGVDEGDNVIVTACVFGIVAEEQPAEANKQVIEIIQRMPLRNIITPFQ